MKALKPMFLFVVLVDLCALNILCYTHLHQSRPVEKISAIKNDAPVSLTRLINLTEKNNNSPKFDPAIFMNGPVKMSEQKMLQQKVQPVFAAKCNYQGQTFSQGDIVKTSSGWIRCDAGSLQALSNSAVLKTTVQNFNALDTLKQDKNAVSENNKPNEKNEKDGNNEKNNERPSGWTNV